MEFSEFMKGLEEFLKDMESKLPEIEKRIKENFDPRKKEVGDRVILWDTSSLEVTEEVKRIKLDEEAIVISDNLSSEIKVEGPLGIPYTFVRDLKLRYKSGLEVLISSDHVKRTDPYGK